MRFALVALFASLNGFAAGPNAVIDGTVLLSGTGCLPGAASVTIVPDKTGLTVLFDDYQMSVDKGSAYKYCSVRIPVNVKPGKRITVKSSEYRGFIGAPKNAAGNFQAWARIMTAMKTTESRRALKTYKGYIDLDFVANPKTLVCSAQCGGKQDILIESFAYLANVSRPSQTAVFAIDSMDFSLTSSKYVSYENCK